MTRAVLVLLAVLLAGPARAQEQVLVEQGTGMRWIANSSDPGLGLSWVQKDFDDSSWAAGVYGLGYETGTGATALIDTLVPLDSDSAYTRAEFVIADPASLENLVLGADWDDGFVAWINGVEVARSPGMPAGEPDWRTRAPLSESSNGAVPDYTPLIDVTDAARAALVPGRNVLAIGVWNANSGSSDLVLVPYLVRDRPPTIVRGPYLQRLLDDSVLVRWRTAGPVSSRVAYGRTGGPLDQVVESPVPTLDHELLLSGLSPATRWSYALDDGVEHSFRTLPPVGAREPLRAWVIGDSGTRDANARAVRDSFRAEQGAGATDLWLLLGDNAYDDGLDSEYQSAVFEMYGEELASVSAWPTLGNHDGISADSLTESGPYYDIFSLPRDGEAGGLPSGTEAYYSFDQANVHFVCLDSFETDRLAGSAMLSWLEDDLAATTQDWVIAFWHHPPYSKGTHDSDLSTALIEMRENAVPVLEAAGVDLVLCGHSHGYERSMQIDGHLGDSATFGPAVILDDGDGEPLSDGAYAKPTPAIAPHEGAVYVVAGSSGKTASAPYDHPAMVVSLEELGSLLLEVNGLRLDARFLDGAQGVRDHFTIVKGCLGAPCVETNCADGLDEDGDGLTDASDPDCAAPDADRDGREDDLDCAPLDPLVFAAPGSPAPLFVRGPVARLEWSDAAPASGLATRHDLLAGRLSELRQDRGLDRVECRAAGVQGAATDDPSLPGAGDAWWYLVRARNDCGDSGVGSASLGARVPPAEPCP